MGKRESKANGRERARGRQVIGESKSQARDAEEQEAGG